MVLELPVLARENQDWKIYRAHILDSAAAEGVVSHLTGAAPKPFDSRELEAWNWSNSVAKYIMLEVISDSLLERLMHHELAHTLFSHLAAIFGDHDPIAIEPSAERSHPVEPLREDSHPKSDGADSARTANTVESTIADVDGKAALGGESAERAYRVDLESRENGIDHGVGPADVPNESETPDGGNIPCVCLGATHWRADNVNGPGIQTDGSNGQADASRGQTDALTMSNRAETVRMRHGEGAGTYLGAGDAKRDVKQTDGVGSHADTSSGHSDVPSVETDADTTANAPQIVRTPRKKIKPPDSPSRSTRRAPDEPNAFGDATNTSTIRTDGHNAGNEKETAVNETKNVRTCQIDPKTQNLPNTPENGTPKSSYRWRKVSVDNIDAYVPRSVPVEALGRTFAFGEAQSGVKAIAPSIDGRDVKERASDGDNDRNGDDGDGDGTASSGNVDSTRIGGVQLAGEAGQHKCPNAEYKRNVPMPSRPPVRPPERPFGPVKRQRRRGRIKFIPTKVSQTPEVETTYHGRARVTQPHGNASRRFWEVHRPRRRRGRMKIEPTNVNQTRNSGNAYLRHINATRSIQRPRKQIRAISKLTFESRTPGEPWRDVEDHG